MKTKILLLGLLALVVVLIGCIEQPPIQPKTEWLSYSPIQCGNNPWEKWREDQGRPYPIEWTEKEKIQEYFQTVYNIEVLDYKSIPPKPGEVFCTACNCPRGDTIQVLVKQKDVAKMLELGWNQSEATEAVRLTTGKTSYVTGETIDFTITNNSGQDIFLSPCETFTFYKKAGNNWTRSVGGNHPNLSGTTCAVPAFRLKVGQSQPFSYTIRPMLDTGNPYGTGAHKIIIKYSNQPFNWQQNLDGLGLFTIESNEFEIVEPASGITLRTDIDNYVTENWIRVQLTNNSQKAIFADENNIVWKVYQKKSDGSYEALLLFPYDPRIGYLPPPSRTIEIKPGEKRLGGWNGVAYRQAQTEGYYPTGTFQIETRYSYEINWDGNFSSLKPPITQIKSNEFEIKAQCQTDADCIGEKSGCYICKSVNDQRQHGCGAIVLPQQQCYKQATSCGCSAGKCVWQPVEQVQKCLQQYR